MSSTYRSIKNKTLSARRRRAKKTRCLIQNKAREVLDAKSKILRLCVCRTARHISVQAIDDLLGATVGSASTLEKAFREEKFTSKVEAAEAVGKKLGERLKDLTFSKVAFDRSGYPYHGRVRALADGVRSAGIVF